jgi:hypothetical protein
MRSFVIESEPPAWRFVGHGDGGTPDEALRRFCEAQEVRDGEFRLKDPNEPTADWTYLAMIDGTPVEKP